MVYQVITVGWIPSIFPLSGRKNMGSICGLTYYLLVHPISISVFLGFLVLSFKLPLMFLKI